MIEFQSISVPYPDSPAGRCEALALVAHTLRTLIKHPEAKGFSIRLTHDLDGKPRLSIIPYSDLIPAKGSPWNA